MHCSPGTLGSWGFGAQASQGWEETASQARNHAAQALTSMVDPWIEGQQLVHERLRDRPPQTLSCLTGQGSQSFPHFPERESLWLNLHDLQSSLQRVFFSREETISPCIPKRPLSPVESYPPWWLAAMPRLLGDPDPAHSPAQARDGGDSISKCPGQPLGVQ